MKLRLYQLALLAAVLGGWHVLTSPTLLPPIYFSNANQAAFFFGEPIKVGQRIVDWFVTGDILIHLGVTLFETLMAFALGTLGGRHCGTRRGRRAARIIRARCRLRRSLSAGDRQENEG